MRCSTSKRGNEPFGHKIQDIDFAKIAEACSAEDYPYSQPEEVETILEKFFAFNKTAVIEVSIDPERDAVSSGEDEGLIQALNLSVAKDLYLTLNAVCYSKSFQRKKNTISVKRS